MKSKILENVRNIRKSQKETQAQMAEKMGMSLTAYGNWERGVTKLNEERIEHFARVNGKTPSSVVNGYESVEGEASTLEEFRAREVQFKDLLASANEKIQYLEKQLRSAENEIDTLKNNVSLLEDIRAMLERQLAGK